ncbi:hypothetical protein [Maridesulfovibrio sp. FT414]|uniref:hypothetical protein n=1 Tax=Maridesulfovibrio sp. FT414 TaxID=2979469 RepID=UPI003D801806
MNELWAVIIAGLLGFWAAVCVMRQREQDKALEGELQLRRREIRKTAALITTHTPREFGGCGGNRNRELAAARLRQLHTTLAVRLSPEGKSDLILLQALDDLIDDIKNGRTGTNGHAEVIRLVAAVLTEQESHKPLGTCIFDTAVGAVKWVYTLPEKLTEYDRERKTN